MEQDVILNYFNTLKHLRIAQPFLNDIQLISNELNNFSYDTAKKLTSNLTSKYKTDINEIGKHYTGVMVFKESELPTKTESEVVDDLLYLQDCIVISGAVHCGLENTIKSALIKIDRANKNNN